MWDKYFLKVNFKLDRMFELNKFETWRTQFNENKIRGLKWILIET